MCVVLKYSRWILFSVVPLAFLALSGCGESGNSDTTSETSSAPVAGQETEAERCRKKLAAAIRRVAPGTLALQEKLERSVNSLNAWVAMCAADDINELKLDEKALGMLGNAARAKAARFTASDAAYIRDCLLLRDLTKTIVAHQAKLGDKQDYSADATRTLAIFEWVVRNVSLFSETEERVPLGLFNVLLTGRGSAKDRAWIFAEALRQQQIDAVLVSANKDGSAEGGSLDTSPWLIAVLLEKESFLFDMSAGLPVPMDGDTNSLDGNPASIAALRDHDRWKDSTVEVVAQVSAFSPRMMVLQEQLAAEDSAILFEELTGGVSEIAPLTERITSVSNGIWKTEDISVWSYPEERVIASSARTEKQRQEFATLMKPFDAPFERKDYNAESIEELTTVPEQLSPEQRKKYVEQRVMENFARMAQSSEEKFGIPSRRLLKTRIMQIAGETGTTVIQQLQQIRIKSMQEVMRVRVPQQLQSQGYPPIMLFSFPKAIRDVNRSCTGDSLYWTAMAQMDRGDFGTAIITLMNYRRQYKDGKWRYQSLVHQGLALLAQGRKDDAKKIIEEANVEENPEQERVKRILASLDE